MREAKPLARVTRPIFAIFEGGGAKGVAHVGAIAAAEANGLTFVGVAGASAGAIVAALLAVGFKALELVDPTAPGADILSRSHVGPTDLLGRRPWRRFKRLLKGGWWLAPRVALGGVALSFLTAPLTSMSAVALALNRGHLSTDGVREFVNGRLREKLADVWANNGVTEPPPDRVLFKHLDDERFDEVLPLKIVGTNTTTRELWIFDRRLTPDTEVAQAVAASIAIPFVFRPVVIDGANGPHRFVDGGLVSNLPVWVFANEKLAYERDHYLDPPVPIIGFTLREASSPPPDRRRSGLMHFIADLVQTSLSGSQAISQNFIQDLTVVPLATSLDVLDFDAPRERMLAAYEDGFRCASRELSHALIAKPDLVRAELQRFHSRVRTALRPFWREPGRSDTGHLRSNLVEALSGGTYRVTYGYNMDRDADDRLPLDARGRGAPAAFQKREMLHCPVGAAWTDPGRDYMTKYERALVRKGVRSIICVPIFRDEDVWLQPLAERPPPAGVISIDSDRDLSVAFADEDFRWLLATQSTILYDVMTKEPERGQRS